MSKVLDTASVKVNGSNGAYVNQLVNASLSGSATFYAIIKTDDFYAMTDPITASTPSSRRIPSTR